MFSNLKRREDRTIVRLIVVSSILLIAQLALGGCAITNPTRGDGNFALAADAKGMKAFGDALNGLVTNGKASPDKDTAHWKARRNQEKEETRRAYAPGFLDNLFGRGAAVPESAESDS